MTRRSALLLCALLAGAALPRAAAAAEVTLLTAGAFKSVAAAIVPEFEARTGHRVTMLNDTAGALSRRIAAGEAFEVAVLPPEAIEALARAGKVQPGAAVPLARVGIGVAVKAGQPAPAIDTVAAFREALLAARAVAYIDPAAGGSSGIYLAGLFNRLGVGEQVAAKSVLVPGGLVAARLVDGTADLALQQMSEILAVPGAMLAGPLPAEVQQYTVYSGVPAAAARDPAAAASLLAALAEAGRRGLLRDKGMDAP